MDWIKVEDQMPEEGQDVILACDGIVLVGYYLLSFAGEVQYWALHKYEKLNPSHWMPLPEPPKQEK